MRARTNSPDYVFLSLIGVLVVFGLVALASASSVVSFEKFGSSFYLLRHQILFGILPGLILFFAALKIPYDLWRRWAVPLLAVTLLMLIFVLLPGIGRQLGGSRSWFTIGSVSFQPSEVMKLALIVYLAAWFARAQGGAFDIKKDLGAPCVVIACAAILILLQPDVGTLAIIGASVVFLLFLAGVPFRYIAGMLLVGAALLFIMVRIAPYRTARLTAFLHPELDPRGVGYHINQALLAVGSGGFLGVGFGHSRQKFRYLPEVTGDSIFPIMAEEFGFFISVGFMILICAILLRMFRIANNSPNTFTRLLVGGIAGWFGIQSFVNIGAMLGLMPLTGLPLPFVSYGGTAMAIELAAVGIVGSISRNVK